MSEKKLKHPLSGKALSAEISALMYGVQRGDQTAEETLLRNCERYIGYAKQVRSAIRRKLKECSKGASYARISASQINASGAWPYQK